MANKKISAFDTLTTIPGGPITFNDVLGIAGYCDDPALPGNNINVQFSGADIIAASSVGINKVLAVNDTTTLGQEIKFVDFAGFNPLTIGNIGLLSSPLVSLEITSGLTLLLESNNSAGSVNLYTNTGAGAGSVLIESRTSLGRLKLKTATDIQVELPVAPTIGQVLAAKNINGYLEWTSSDVAITKAGNSTFIVEVKDVEDFPGGTGLGATISLAADTTYIIRGEVDILLDTIDVQVDNSAIIGFDRNKDILKASTLVGTMITIGDPTLATYNEFNFTLDNIGLQVPLGRVLEAENIDSTIEAGSIFGRNKVLQITNCEIKDTLKVWTIIGFELVDLLNNLIWFIDGTTSDSGCQFKSIRHLEINSCEVFNWTAVVTNAPRMLELMADNISTAGGSVSQFNAVVNIAGCIIHPINDQIGLYIDSASETKFGTVASNTFIDVNLNTPTGKLFDPLPSTGGYSLASTLTYDIGLNQGIPNSIAYGSFYDSTGGIDTLTGGTTNWIPVEYGAVPLAAATQRISFSTPATQRGLLTYNGTKSIFTQVSVSITYNDTSGGTDIYNFGLSKNGTATPEAASVISSQASGGAYFGVTLLFTDSMVPGDNYELIAQNPGGGAGDDIEVTSVQFLIKE